MKEISVDNLEGIDLDYWVAKAEGLSALWREDIPREVTEAPKNVWKISKHLGRDWFIQDGAYGLEWLHIDWSFIGPIIERDKIVLDHSRIEMRMQGPIEWSAYSHLDAESLPLAHGREALLAIKRLIVKRKYGATIES